jgi:hypothetical protein
MGWNSLEKAWYEYKPEELEVKCWEGRFSEKDVDWCEVIKVEKDRYNDACGHKHKVFFKSKEKEDSWYFTDLGEAMGFDKRVFAKVRVKQTIKWDEPLEVKIWGFPNAYFNTDWTDVINITSPMSREGENLESEYYRDAFYKTKARTKAYFHFQKDGFCKSSDGKIFGKVRNKKESTKGSVYINGIKYDGCEFGEPLMIFHFAKTEDLLANLKDSQGKDMKVPKAKDMKAQPLLKNNIVIERFSDKVVVREINLMTYDEISEKYGEEITKRYVQNSPHMLLETKKQLNIFSSQRQWALVKVFNEYSITEWSRIWSEIKECGKRLSDIIKSQNKKAEKGEKEVLYV